MQHGLGLKRLLALGFAAALLAACNTGSITDGLTPTAQMRQTPPASIGSETALAPQTQTSSAPEAALAQPGSQSQSASLGGTVSPVSFLPVTGAPQSAVTNLASSMRQAAQKQQIPVVVSVEQGARYQVKGYFSALDDGSGTVLVYVWDVLDQNGARVHRISGQERGPASNGDPWSGVSEEVLARVAEITMNSLRSWMSTRNAG